MLSGSIETTLDMDRNHRFLHKINPKRVASEFHHSRVWVFLELKAIGFHIKIFVSEVKNQLKNVKDLFVC